jgi:hypothetical protein
VARVVDPERMKLLLLIFVLIKVTPEHSFKSQIVMEKKTL